MVMMTVKLQKKIAESIGLPQPPCNIYFHQIYTQAAPTSSLPCILSGDDLLFNIMHPAIAICWHTTWA